MNQRMPFLKHFTLVEEKNKIFLRIILINDEMKSVKSLSI